MSGYILQLSLHLSLEIFLTFLGFWGSFSHKNVSYKKTV